MSGMFAVLVSGRLVQTDFQQVDTNKFLINIPNVDEVNHIAVFMTGTQPLPADMGASVHFSWPDPSQPVSIWRCLGMISNEKPSAIFKITNYKAPNDCSGFFANQQTVAHFAQIGLSVEPLASLNAQISELHKNGDQQLAIASSPQQELRPDHLKLFATRTAESLFNHVASFSTSAPGTCEQIVPVSAIQSWFNNYKRKLEVKPDFWMNNSI